MAFLVRSRRGRPRIKVRALVALAGGLLAFGLVWLYRPLHTIREQSLRMAQLRAAKSALAAQESSIESEKRFLATEAGQEEAIRQRGYLRPGERRLVFVPETAPRPKSVKPNSSSPSAPKP